MARSSDIAMPGLDGIEAVSVIHERQPDIRIVLVSVHSDPILIERGFAAGASGYVLKRMAGDDLVPAVHEVGGFGAGSDFTWQVFPTLSLRLTDKASLEFGYRWLDIDYDTGERNEQFRYDVLTQGPVVGFGLRF